MCKICKPLILHVVFTDFNEIPFQISMSLQLTEADNKRKNQ